MDIRRLADQLKFDFRLSNLDLTKLIASYIVYEFSKGFVIEKELDIPQCEIQEEMDVDDFEYLDKPRRDLEIIETQLIPYFVQTYELNEYACQCIFALADEQCKFMLLLYRQRNYKTLKMKMAYYEFGFNYRFAFYIGDGNAESEAINTLMFRKFKLEKYSRLSPELLTNFNKLSELAENRGDIYSEF